ncbi:MAG: hypothetical protein LBD02_01930 [Christensenellaceae bacterium]|jgi:hypothetical protein|nr:hypothetical protein [Christensenellaceae bacterium]
MLKPKLFKERAAEAQPSEGLEGLQATLEELGIEPGDAEGILRQVVERSRGQRELAARVLDAIEAIGDENFTLEALRANEKAMRELERGAPTGEIYRKYFMKAKLPRSERDANLGAGAARGMELSREDIERISEYVDRTGKVFQL